MATSPTTIIAYATEDNRFPELGRTARQTAAQSEARLVLFDVGPGAVRAAHDRPDLAGSLLNDAQLDRAGLPGLAQQVRDAQNQGIETYGFLPSSVDADVVAAYADEQHADLVMVPQAMAEPELREVLRRRAAKRLGDKFDQPLALVADDGSFEFA